tara:strand:+ start:13093 stop:13857 length:765 start_codon:yes stop_codon:yes gene_type:complete
MHRSGSTWLYNTLRHIFILNQQSVYGCFSTHYDASNKKDIHIIKTHRFKKRLLEIADFIFLTRRDPRDIVASAVKRKLILETDALKYLNNVFYKEYYPWQGELDLEIVYEKMTNNKPLYTKKIAEILSVETAPTEICKVVENLTTDDPTNHLHPHHRAGGKVGDYDAINTLRIMKDHLKPSGIILLHEARMEFTTEKEAEEKYKQCPHHVIQKPISLFEKHINLKWEEVECNKKHHHQFILHNPNLFNAPSKSW